VNFVGPERLDGIAVSANEYDSSVDEFLLAGVATEASCLVKPPRVSDSLASLECRLYQSIELGDNDCQVDLIIGVIVHAYVREESAASPPASPEVRKFRGIGALGLDWYLVAAEAKYMPQPPYASPASPRTSKAGDIADH
jgi:flavin reductase (DIM6/NTAB) family NADH-FMN oxidoreductase RutF